MTTYLKNILLPVLLLAQVINGTTQEDSLFTSLLDVATNHRVTIEAEKGLNQTLEPIKWHELLLERFKPRVGGSESPTLAGSNAPKKITTRPEELITYRSLNIFYFLEDHALLQRCLLGRCYQGAPSTATQRPYRSKIRIGQRPSVLGPDGKPVINLRSTYYPVVRDRIIFTSGEVVNPKHFSSGRGRRAPDFSYRQNYEDAQALQQLYQLALNDMSTDQLHRFGLPTVFYSEARITIKRQLQGYRLQFFERIKAEAKRQLAQMKSSSGRPYQAGQDLTMEEMRLVQPALAQKRLPADLLRLMPRIGQNLQMLGQPFLIELNQIKTQRAKVETLLSPEEKAFFSWLERQSLLMLHPLSAAMRGINDISSNPNTATYGKLIVASELLHLAEERCEGPATNEGVDELLQQITYQYYQKVQQAQNVFYDKAN